MGGPCPPITTSVPSADWTDDRINHYLNHQLNALDHTQHNLLSLAYTSS